MKIYKLSQSIVDGYDTYSDCVVVAENEDEARRIHPSSYVVEIINGKWHGRYDCPDKPDKHNKPYESRGSDWVQFEDIDKITVEEIGEAKKGINKRIICTSFHAG